MDYETVHIFVRTRTPDFVNFEGVIRFGLSAPFKEPQVSRSLNFEVKSWRRPNSRVIFKDGEEVIADLDAEVLKTFPPLADLDAEPLRQFTPVQRQVLRLLTRGAQHGVLSEWGLLDPFRTQVLRGITREDVRTVQFAPLTSTVQ